MGRRVDPDYVIDADRGSSEQSTTKIASVTEPAVFQERSLTREGARTLDVDVERLPGLTRQQRDRERAMPRDTTAELNARMDPGLPAAEQVRRPPSSRQRKARSVDKRATQNQLPLTQKQALTRLLSAPERWRGINDQLSDAAGDAQELTDADRVQVQRVDRAIQTYERTNTRSHLVYCNVEIPRTVGPPTLASAATDAFPVDAVVCFDRYTGAAHSLHEIETTRPYAEAATAVFEIHTHRGMYLGRSDSLDDTAHLLPRGLRLQVRGTHEAAYQRPDGTVARRQVIQLEQAADPDATTTPPERR